MKPLGLTLSAGLLISVASSSLCLGQTAPCPSTTAICGFNTPTFSGDQGSTTCYDDTYGGGGDVAFNYAQGTSSIHFFNDKVALTTEDSFHFDGPVPGQTIHARVSLALNGQACNGDVASVSATLQVTPGLAQDYLLLGPIQSGGCKTGSQTLTQDVAFVSGETFTIRVTLDSNHGGGGSGFLSAALQFEQIPANVVVRSCHGYRQDGPVPALARSWGAVKSLYR
jgi:hypothetical protein